MRAIAFVWTTPALLAGAKTCTRRQWKDRYALSFRQGELVVAYDRQPRHGGKQVATIRLLREPYRSAELPSEDWQREGFAWAQERGMIIDGMSPRKLWMLWHVQRKLWWVIRFEVVELTAAGQAILDAVSRGEGR